LSSLMVNLVSSVAFILVQYWVKGEGEPPT
jgi:hypothetical protein